MDNVINISINPELVNIANPTWDTFFVLFFIIATLLYSFFVNRERLGVVLLSTYSTIALVSSTPLLRDYLASMPSQEGIPYRIGIFLLFFFALFVLFSSHLSLRADSGQPWLFGLLLSFLQVGLLLSAILSYVPTDVFTTKFVRSFFTDDIPRTAWMLAPICVMVFMRHRQPSGGGTN